MAMAVAGFSGGEAEELRRALGFRRSTARMEAIEERLRAGMAARGITGAVQEEIVTQITAFALYGFPESHAASFALIAYASAYLKAHHPAAFACALLNCWPMGFYHPATVVKDAQRHGVAVLPIDAARSHWRCTIEGGALRLGLRYVLGSGRRRPSGSSRRGRSRPSPRRRRAGGSGRTRSTRSRTRAPSPASVSRGARRSGRRRPRSATPRACSPACARPPPRRRCRR
jgi:error-prone DNA polymerase